MAQTSWLIVVRCLAVLILSCAISAITIKRLIVREHKLSFAQAIRSDIVSTHQQKKGTPTMGGIGILLGAIIAFIAVNPFFFKSSTAIALLVITVAFFVIGFLDDWRKIKKKNAKGLSAGIRFFSEIAVVMLILVYLNYGQKSQWGIHLPYPHEFIYVGAFFIIIAILMVVGSSNGVNMTDGLDGLAAGLMLMALAPFVIISLNKGMYDISFFLLAIIGALIGFLFFNFHPAKIFMGDCGSLPLGAILALSALMLNVEFLLIVAGGLFVVETASVILQVASFKMRKKRIFKMAPLHHHFEMKGMQEARVVILFYLGGFVLSFLATLLGVLK